MCRRSSTGISRWLEAGAKSVGKSVVSVCSFCGDGEASSTWFSWTCSALCCGCLVRRCETVVFSAFQEVQHGNSCYKRLAGVYALERYSSGELPARFFATHQQNFRSLSRCLLQKSRSIRHQPLAPRYPAEPGKVKRYRFRCRMAVKSACCIQEWNCACQIFIILSIVGVFRLENCEQ
jgi:hypothetical protein